MLYTAVSHVREYIAALNRCLESLDPGLTLTCRAPHPSFDIGDPRTASCGGLAVPETMTVMQLREFLTRLDWYLGRILGMIYEHPPAR